MSEKLDEHSPEAIIEVKESRRQVGYFVAPRPRERRLPLISTA